MATLATIRTAMAAALDNVAGLNVYNQMPDVMSSPAAVVLVRSQQQLTMGGSGGLFRLDIEVGLYVVSPGIENAQEAIDPYLGPSGASSIYLALAADTTLGGVVDGIMLAGGWSAYSTVQINGVEYVRAFLRVPVYYKG